MYAGLQDAACAAAAVEAAESSTAALDDLVRLSRRVFGAGDAGVLAAKTTSLSGSFFSSESSVMMEWGDMEGDAAGFGESP
mmetsp:Transcript_9647/g.14188  ORF Transcript_9647/g.14188 Transcript_9647/m.14188 type:complete len:81 (+) Transcript_9647:211-453(+)